MLIWGMFHCFILFYSCEVPFSTVLRRHHSLPDAKAPVQLGLLKKLLLQAAILAPQPSFP